MRILIVIDSIGTGGAQKLKAELALGISSQGNDVDIFIYNDSDDQYFAKDLKKSGIKIFSVSRKRNGFSFKVLSELRKVLKGDYDAVISSMHTPSIYASIAMIGIKKYKFIVCDESSSIASVPFLKKYLFYLSTLISDFVVPNSFNEANLMKKLPGRSKKIHPIWNGYELSNIKSKSKDNHDFKLEKKLLIVGRIAYPKNGLNLLKGLSLFLLRNGWLPSINWVGRDDNEQKSRNMKKAMNDYLSENPLLSSYWNWAGIVEDVQDFYLTSDALIHVSIYEGLPNVICEAMLSECFVIASNVCDHPKILGEDRGLLCNPHKPESICQSIEKFYLMDTNERMNIIKNAKNFAEIEFDRNTMTEKYMSLIK